MTTAVITGANRGIGLELAHQLNDRGTEVIAVCRQSSPQLDELGVRIEAGVDVCNLDDLRTLGSRLKDVNIDILINNAGVLRRQTLGEIDEHAINDIRLQFETNSLAPLLVTQALMGSLRSGSKIAIVTSRMGSIADNTSGGSYGYRMSKAAVNMAGASLAYDLKDRGIDVVLLHPGWVRTEMTGGTGQMSASEAARGLLQRIDELTPDTTGHFYHSNGESLPW